jgi:serine/threonine-protein kinase
LERAPQDLLNIDIAPDGHRLAIAGRDAQIYVYDTKRGNASLFTQQGLSHSAPVWSPDSRYIVHSTALNGPPNLFVRPVDGSGPPQRLTTSRLVHFANAWHPDGTALLFIERSSDSSFDLKVLPISRSADGSWKVGEPAIVAATPANEAWGTFSPDGRSIAYLSDEEGRTQLYVRPFPGPGGKWKVSDDAVATGRWSSNGRDLIYATVAGDLMVVGYRTDKNTFTTERPRRWSPTTAAIPLSGFAFALHPDGKRAVLSPISGSRKSARPGFVLGVGLAGQLRMRAPASR